MYFHGCASQRNKLELRIYRSLVDLLHPLQRHIRPELLMENVFSMTLRTVFMNYQGMSNASFVRQFDSTDHMTIF